LSSKFAPHGDLLPAMDPLHLHHPSVHHSMSAEVTHHCHYGWFHCAKGTLSCTEVCSQQWICFSHVAPHHITAAPWCTPPASPFRSMPHPVSKHHIRLHSNGIKFTPNFIQIQPVVLEMNHVSRKTDTHTDKHDQPYMRSFHADCGKECIITSDYTMRHSL
jgi:hypothetical protein